MIANQAPGIETLIREYVLYKEQSMQYGKKRLDAEKEYNKLLTRYNGEAKHYSLEQAENIYKAYQDMIANAEASDKAQVKFAEAETKLNEVGRILFEATINAEIMLSPSNGGLPSTRPVAVTYHNGQVVVS